MQNSFKIVKLSLLFSWIISHCVYIGQQRVIIIQAFLLWGPSLSFSASDLE